MYICYLCEFKETLVNIFTRNVRLLMSGKCHALFHVSCCYSNRYIKIGTIQRRLAWIPRKDNTQIREVFQIFQTDKQHKKKQLLVVLLMVIHELQILNRTTQSQPEKVHQSVHQLSAKATATNIS